MHASPEETAGFHSHNGLHFIAPGDAGQETAGVRRDQRPTVFRAEGAVEVGAYVGHSPNSVVPSGLMQYGTCAPNVKTLGYSRNVPSGQELGTSIRDNNTHECFLLRSSQVCFHTLGYFRNVPSGQQLGTSIRTTTRMKIFAALE